MKVPSLTSNRSTKRSNLIRERPLMNRRDLIRLTSKSPCHLLSGFRSAAHYRAGERLKRERGLSKQRHPVTFGFEFSRNPATGWRSDGCCIYERVYPESQR